MYFFVTVFPADYGDHSDSRCMLEVAVHWKSLYAGGCCMLEVAVRWRSLYAGSCCTLAITVGSCYRLLVAVVCH